MAIGIKCTRAEAGYDLSASKFFGTPTLPLGWEEEYEESVLFFAQIRLADIAPFDKENRLPHTGYLYLFLDTKDGKYHMRPILRYHDGEPALAIDGFNAVVEGYEQYTAAYLMSFYAAPDGEEGTRLFGTPADWSYGDAPPDLLLQYDPLDGDMGFLDDIDGFLYFFFGENKEDPSAVTLHTEHT